MLKTPIRNYAIPKQTHITSRASCDAKNYSQNTVVYKKIEYEVCPKPVKYFKYTWSTWTRFPDKWEQLEPKRLTLSSTIYKEICNPTIPLTAPWCFI